MLDILLAFALGLVIGILLGPIVVCLMLSKEDIV